VQRYLPWFRVAGPDASAWITVRHLLNHTSGLPASVELYQPDLFWLLGQRFLVALVWGPIRAVLTVQALQPRQPAVPAGRLAPAPAQ
jgi:CubicO group peptidase (beta-lactamase class C family)